jgi:hypothetical protein
MTLPVTQNAPTQFIISDEVMSVEWKSIPRKIANLLLTIEQCDGLLEEITVKKASQHNCRFILKAVVTRPVQRDAE